LAGRRYGAVFVHRVAGALSCRWSIFKGREMSHIHANFKMKLDDFLLEASFEITAVGITAFFGPSGSGKTTLLRCIAGLERSTGSFHVEGDIWQNEDTFIPTYQRPIGYVFQEASLFSHLSIRDNLEYGYKRVALADRRVSLDQVVEWLGLSQIIERSDPNKLSGGERQRVAIGRALLTSPQLLLMDEPLASLDTVSKQKILPYLECLHRELEIPILYVSHSLEEVARLADHLVLLEQGQVIASGALNEMLPRLDLPTAHLDDTGVVIEATVTEQDATYHLTRLEFSGGNLWVGKVNQSLGSLVRARVLARDVSIVLEHPKDTSISNILLARIVDIRDEGSDKVNVRMEIGDAQVLLSRITRRSRDLLNLTAGMEVYAQVKSVVLNMGSA